MHHSQLLLRANSGKRFEGQTRVERIFFHFRDESVGGNNVIKPEIPNRVEDGSSENRQILYERESARVKTKGKID
jgi:hypothetical protein